MELSLDILSKLFMQPVFFLALKLTFKERL